HNAETKYGEGLAMLLTRKGIEQNRLAQSYKRRTTHALRYAEGHHAEEIPRYATQGRGNNKTDDCDIKQPASSHPLGERARERHPHSRRNEIRGKYPSYLIGGNAEAAKHVRDGHADDGDVEHLENCGEHYGNNQRDRGALIHFHPPNAGRARRGRLLSRASEPSRYSICVRPFALIPPVPILSL